ncbi:MAG: prepilin-type N-terminal cleavage/methylation domain-containing protein [Gammaproteobacteria bacterium]
MNWPRVRKLALLPRQGSGFSLIEVLVTIVIVVIGLLGWAGLQSKASVVQMEAYQRAQGLALMRDMQDRIMSARGLLDVATGSPPVVTTPGFQSFAASDGSIVFGTGDSYTDCATVPNPAESQLCLWGQALKGAAESSAGSQVGAMIGARGCIINVSPPTDFALADFFIVVVWQGLTPTADPDAGTPAALCASGVNFGTGLRRAVVTRVMIPKLVG